MFREESPLTPAVFQSENFSSLKSLSNQCKYVKEESVHINPKGTGDFVDSHINHYRQLVLFMMERTWQ